MSEIQDTVQLTKELKEHYPDLTSHEACDLATKIRRNEHFYDAFVISDRSPSPLEAIAMTLGYEHGGNGPSVAQAIRDMADKE